ncbi:hypothetical protein [Oleiagrimonas sp.]|jgi:hypothetical protein|uniref:hypothetical protein n=1 Tax=Oleiagrimonas sp. TaxID=2010330 RepID=UPI002619C27C|nr:hypothetical protein [Oleiagrimonas sp.]MDA3915006.1 hypothetical protein [Oleiagrimonas sp.]
MRGMSRIKRYRGQRRNRDHGLLVTLVDRAGLHHEIDVLDPDNVRQWISLDLGEGAYMGQAGRPPLVASRPPPRVPPRCVTNDFPDLSPDNIGLIMDYRCCTEKR